jgi:zona occludens toxin
MIYLITGTPSGGKTLNTLKYVNEDDQFCVRVPAPSDPDRFIIKLDENGKKVRRPVYYFNINKLTLDWIEIDIEQVKTWQSLPDNSVIVVDEVQRVFPKRNNKDDTPRGVSELDTHRHRGFDFLFITQHPTLVDHDLRKFVGQHRHYERSFALESARLLTWQKAQYNVDDYHTKQEAQVSRVRFDKKYYKVYKSSTDHNIKKRMPLKLWLLIALMVLVFSGIIYFASTFGDKPAFVSPQLSPLGLSNSSLDTKDMSYLEKLVPRIATLPQTAPIYDDLQDPLSYPRISACVATLADTACQCYSQQATKMTIPLDSCLAIVKDGYFDPMKPDSREDTDKDQKQRLVIRSTSKVKPSVPFNIVSPIYSSY